MSEQVVVRRTGRRIESKAKRWSAPPSEKGFSPAINTPDQITRDVRGLKLRQRVSIVLGDEVLREELEEVVGNVDITNKTTNLKSYRTYQDFLIPTGGIAGGAQGVPVTPIADIRGMETIKLTKEERLLRCKIAAVYRLALEFNWASCDYDQVLCTARAHEDDYYYLTSPVGMLFNEITAASLIKMDLEGNTVESGTTNFGPNKLGDQVHCIIYETLKDVNCVMCLTSLAVKAVSAMECGLLPISKDAVAVGEATYYALSGVGFDKEDKEELIRKCEKVDKVLFLRNVGAICIGKSIEEMVYVAHLLNQACQYQINAMRAGVENLVHIDKDVRKKVYLSLHEADDTNQNKQSYSSILFAAWMRMLDGKGHKTGYEYSTEVFKREEPPSPTKPTKAKTPAKASSFRYEQQDRDRNPVRRAHTTGRAYNRTKLKWLNEPIKSTEYKKEPYLESPNIETVIAKDRQPERTDKDAKEMNEIIEESVGVKVEAISESAPDEEIKVVETTEEPTKTTVTTVVTTIETKAEEEAKEKADEAKKADDKLLSPEGDSGHGSKKRKKVKKSRSFKDALKETFSKKKSPGKSKEEKAAEKHSEKAAEKID